MQKIKPKIPVQKAKETIEDIKPKKVKIEKLNDISQEEEEKTHEQFRDSIKPEVDKEVLKNTEKTEFIDISAKSSDIDKDEKVKVNFLNNNFMEDYIKKDTETGAKKEDASSPDNSKENKNQTKQTNNQVMPDVSSGNDFTKDDFADFAEVFMDIIDMGISTGLRFWAKDTSTYAYEIQADKKRRLVKQLTNLFMKYQTKFSLEFMFIITLLICYSVPFSKANERRKLLAAGGTPEKRVGGKPTK